MADELADADAVGDGLVLAEEPVDGVADGDPLADGAGVGVVAGAVVAPLFGASRSTSRNSSWAVVPTRFTTFCVPAPGTADPSRLSAGRAPVMPAAHTKHPDGRPVAEPGGLRALWLEEGDGVVLLEYGGPLAVLAGWCDMARGMPG